jgi:hypothetical protein
MIWRVPTLFAGRRVDAAIAPPASDTSNARIATTIDGVSLRMFPSSSIPKEREDGRSDA